MTDFTHSTSGGFEGVYYEDALPLAFHAAPAPEPARLAGLNADNVQLLMADASLDESRVVSADSKSSDDDSSVAEDLHRLEHKINVLIQLVARLVAKDEQLPAPRAWRLYASGVEWRHDDVLSEGTTGCVHLFVSRLLPQALQLPGRVVSARVDDSGATWARFEFAGLSGSVIEGLERMIFRHHRRAVAGVRTLVRD